MATEELSTIGGAPDHILITNATVAVVISYHGIRADSCIGAGDGTIRQ
jgi:hypothetical protein